MQPSPADQNIAAVTAYRENRGGGSVGMQSVLNVIANGATRYRRSWYAECTHPGRYASMTAKCDPETVVWGGEQDPSWLTAQNLVTDLVLGKLPDITNGSTLYYQPDSLQRWQLYKLPDGRLVHMPHDWDSAKVEFHGEIANQLFFKEL